MSATIGTRRPPWWYFVLALVVVPALWLPGTVVLAAAVTAGSPGALAAAVALAAAGIAAIAAVGSARGMDPRWVAAAVIAAVVAGAGWTLVEVLVFLGLTCEGAGPCFN